MTAADVKFTFDGIAQEETAFFNGQMGNVASVEAPDDYTVVFTLKDANVAMIGYLGWYGTFIMPKHIYDNGQKWDENPAAMNPIGCGPFTFGEFKQGEKIVINANPDYFGGAPKVSQVVFTIIPDDSTAVQALINGEIDVLEGVPASEVANLQANPDVRLVLNQYPSPMYVVFNLTHEELQGPGPAHRHRHRDQQAGSFRQNFPGHPETRIQHVPVADRMGIQQRADFAVVRPRWRPQDPGRRRL